MSKNNQNNVLDRSENYGKDFSLKDQPMSFVISIHMRNMFATYGTANVKHVLKELFNIDMAPSRVELDKAIPEEWKNADES